MKNLLMRLIPCAYLLDRLVVIFCRLNDFLFFLGTTILDKDDLLVIIILWLLLLLFIFVFMLLILLVHDLIFNLRTLQPIGYDLQLLILRLLLLVLVDMWRFLLIVFMDHLNQLLAGLLRWGRDGHRGL